jgi:hypothetical protein
MDFGLEGAIGQKCELLKRANIFVDLLFDDEMMKTKLSNEWMPSHFPKKDAKL